MSPIDRIPPPVLSHEIQYVIAATGVWSRLWRSARAAWRCARLARRRRPCTPVQS